MHKKIKLIIINSFIVFLGISFTLLHAYIYTSRMHEGLENYLFRCHDFGQYISESEDYSREWIELLRTMETGKEPFLFLIISSFKRLTGHNIQTSYIVTDIVIHTLTILFWYIMVLRLTKRKILWIMFIILMGTSLVDAVWLNKLFSRQALSNFFLLGLCASYTIALTAKEKNIKQVILVGIFFWWAFISHRISLVFASISILLIWLYDIHRKRYQNLKMLFLWVLFWLILTAPYLTIFIWNFIEYLMLKFNNYLSINNGSKEFINSSSLDKSLWVAIIDWNNDNLSALWNFIQNQWFLLIGMIAGIKNILTFGQKEENTHQSLFFLSILIISTLYISTSLSFSNRVVLTFNLLLLIWIIIYFFSMQKNKYTVIIVFNLICVLWLSMAAPITISWEKTMARRAFKADLDASISFMRTNINPEGSFLLGPHCMNEFGLQLWYETALNFSNLTLWQQKKKVAEGQINFEQLSWQSAALSYSLFENNFMIEQLENQKLYILFGPYFWEKQKREIKKIKDKDPYYFSQDYIKLIYQNPDPAWYLTYIFEVDETKLVYFADQNYFNRIIGKYK